MTVSGVSSKKHRSPPRLLGAGHHPRCDHLDTERPLAEFGGGSFTLQPVESLHSPGGRCFCAQKPQPSGQSLGAAALVPELSLAGASDATPAIRLDGREVIFSSSRAGGFGAADLWSGVRAGVGEPWSRPENLGTPINLASTDNGAFLSRDGRVLLYSSNRSGGVGVQDLWMATRTRIGR